MALGTWGRRSSWLLLGVVGLFLVHSLFFFHGVRSIFDDAFITFRYSHHLASGLGPVFNPGERVEGYTNFLWMIVLAGVGRLGASIPAASQLLGILSGCALLIAITRLGRNLGLGESYSVLPALALAVTPSFARYAVSGMETLLFAFWVTLGLVLVASPPSSLRGAAGASTVLVMGALTRPEGLLFAAVGVLYFAWAVWFGTQQADSRRRISLLAAWVAPWLLISLPYFLWRWQYYGDLLPNTFYAKVGSGSLALASRGASYLGLMLPIVNPFLTLLLMLLPWLRLSPSRVYLLGTATAYLAYLVVVGGDDYMIFGPRFLLAVFPALYVLGFGSLAGLLERARARWRRPFLLGTMLLGALLLVGYGQFERLSYRHIMETMTRGWLAAGNWMRDALPANSLVAVDAAGIIPYVTGFETIDMYGLTDRHIAHLPWPTLGEGPAAHEKFDPLYILRRNPDYVCVWIDEEGRPAAAGLGAHAGSFLNQYDLRAMVLMRQPLEGESEVRVVDGFESSLYATGYIYGIFARHSEGPAE
jgi:hypothetical protein